MNWIIHHKYRVLIVCVISLLVFGVSFYFLHDDKNGSLTTPQPSDLNDPGSDPENNPDSVPSYREVLEYVMLARKRPLLPEEVDRVMLLAENTYPLTAQYSLTILTSLNLPDNRDQIIRLLHQNLNHESEYVRSTAIAGLGNMGAKDSAKQIVPFLKSQLEVERNSARIALKKIDYKFPEEPRPKDPNDN